MSTERLLRSEDEKINSTLMFLLVLSSRFFLFTRESVALKFLIDKVYSGILVVKVRNYGSLIYDLVSRGIG